MSLDVGERDEGWQVATLPYCVLLAGGRDWLDFISGLIEKLSRQV